MRILLFSNFSFPYSCADATRVLNFAKLFKELGHKIDVLGVQYAKQGALSGEAEGISYEMLQATQWTGLKAYKRVKQLEKDIQAYLSAQDRYDAILLSNVYYDLSNVFIRYAKKTGAKLMVNAVEWYEKDNVQFDGIKGKINFIKNRIALRCIHKKMGNIIAISSLLDDYYQKRGCQTVTIPTIIDMEEYSLVRKREKQYENVVNIAYTGNPGRKDYIVNAIYALEYLTDTERNKIRLHFYGATKEKVCQDDDFRACVEKYDKQITFHGRIPYVEVKEKIASADFTVLLRPNKRYANAGFPTKVGESMACGTPVIANLTSDLGKYIIDGRTGIVCENETPIACARAFQKAAIISIAQKKEMRETVLTCSEEMFDYRSYQDVLMRFLSDLK